MRKLRRTAASDNSRAVSLKRGENTSTGDGDMTAIIANNGRHSDRDISR